jgi:ribosomal protein L19E
MGVLELNPLQRMGPAGQVPDFEKKCKVQNSRKGSCCGKNNARLLEDFRWKECSISKKHKNNAKYSKKCENIENKKCKVCRKLLPIILLKISIYMQRVEWMGSIMWILGGKNARFPKNTKMIQKIRKCAKILKIKNAKYAENYSQ